MRRNLAIKKDWIVPTALAFLLVISTACDAQDVKSDATSSSSSPSSSDLPLVIVDADLYHYADDHEAFVMIANLHQRGMIELLGLTLVTGNHWLSQIESDALKAVERLNLQSEIPVLSGRKTTSAPQSEMFLHKIKIFTAQFMQELGRRKIVSQHRLTDCPQSDHKNNTRLISLSKHYEHTQERSQLWLSVR